ncbi:hypothetical protein [Hyphomicrobium sp.]|uniref:hypothetical protein n=1 Tax=Hyphomicrobium sp. TaxID=82 RepID=UPI002D7A383E|nr:hypothetical protein [Hyphomicrobium sp.]HET6388503.1 hypothetical protein [Hyphomicrobium sp.]
MQTVICIKWGSRYGVDYVNRLASMVRRNTRRETRLICFTDDAQGVDPWVQTAPLPPINLPARESTTPWRKLSLWQYPLLDLEGDVLFFDLDVVITGPIDDLFDYEPGRFCVAQNWTQPNERIGNTSIYRFPAGKMSHIFDTFNADPEAILSRYRIEQQYISAESEDVVFFPPEWCLSFKHSLVPIWPLNFFVTPRLPPEARVVAFHGKPDPDEARDGVWPVNATWKKFYKFVLPTPWISEHWR